MNKAKKKRFEGCYSWEEKVLSIYQNVDFEVWFLEALKIEQYVDLHLSDFYQERKIH